MIKNSFVLLNGISYGKERQLWKEEIKDWNDFVSHDKIKGISRRRKMVYNYILSEAKSALLDGNTEFFHEFLPRKEHWRMYDYFKDECIFLDIEMSHVSDGYITCITLFDGNNVMTFVKNHNLDFTAIKNLLSKYKMIITFNGNTFDLPFLEKYSPNLIPKVPCWDLRHSCSALGLTGGLKEVEEKLGIKRQNAIVQKMYGGDPLKLWKTYLATGDKYYLDLLVEYNQEDTVNLKFIADKVYWMMKEKICI